MRYRPATIDDVALLAGMNLRLIRDEGHRNPMTLPELEVRMRGWLESGEYDAWIFENGTEAVGYALSRREAQWTYLRQFFVEPVHRRGGVGRAAIEWLIANAWRDSPRLRLEVLVGNSAAIGFWGSVGFSDYCLTMERDLAPSPPYPGERAGVRG